MHQRAGKQKQVRQRAQQVGAMFGNQEKCGNRQKGNENPIVPAWSGLRIVPAMLVMFHHVLLCEIVRLRQLRPCWYSNSASMACTPRLRTCTPMAWMPAPGIRK